MKITPNPPIPHSYPFYVCPLDSEAGLLVVIRPGYNPLGGMACALHLYLQRRWHHLTGLYSEIC